MSKLNRQRLAYELWELPRHDEFYFSESALSALDNYNKRASIIDSLQLQLAYLQEERLQNALIDEANVDKFFQAMRDAIEVFVMEHY